MPTPDSHVRCRSIKDFEKVKFCQGFWIKKVFFNNFVLEGSGPFLCAFFEIQKMAFT